MSEFAERAKRLAASVIAMHERSMETKRRASAANWQIGRMLHAMHSLSEGKQVMHFGAPLRDWVGRNLKDDRGRPRTWSWARTLISMYETLSPFTGIVEKLEANAYPWAKAHLVMRLMVLEDWQRAEMTRLHGEGHQGPKHPEVHRRVEEKFDLRIQESELSLRTRISDAAGRERTEWSRVGGTCTKEERLDWEEAVLIASSLAGEEPPRSWRDQLAVVCEALRMVRDAAAVRSSKEVEDE